MPATTRTSDIRINCEIHILDHEGFCSAMGIDAVENLTTDILDNKMIVINQELDLIGLADIGSESLDVDGDRVIFDLVAGVSDPEAMTFHAQRRYEACWGDGNWHPESREEALYELALASNDNPSPDALGFEFVDVTLTPSPGDPGDIGP